MGIFTQEFLDASPNGGFIPIDGSSPGTLIHTTPATDIDNLWLWFAATQNVNSDCHLLLNGVEAVRFRLFRDAGPTLVWSGAPISGSTPIRAYCENGSGRAAVFGAVERIASSGTVSSRYFSRSVLSGSVSGRHIPINSTTSPGTTVHTAHATALDRVWVWITPSVDKNTVCWVYDGTTPILVRTNRDLGPVPVLQGIPFSNSTVISAYADSAAEVSAYGGVDRVA